jgi:hypothetical protein
MKYLVFKNGQTLGPFSSEDIADGLASAKLAPTDMCWREGIPDWAPLREVDNLCKGTPCPLGTSDRMDRTSSSNKERTQDFEEPPHSAPNLVSASTLVQNFRARVVSPFGN